jgi:hypothetical protein
VETNLLHHKTENILVLLLVIFLAHQQKEVNKRQSMTFDIRRPFSLGVRNPSAAVTNFFLFIIFTQLRVP